jgi:hypothetical protein
MTSATVSVSDREAKKPRCVDVSGCDGDSSAMVAAMLRDHRMLGHDDGEGRPLRYMSLYGGMVTKML